MSEVIKLFLSLILITGIIIGGILLYFHLSWKAYKKKRWAQMEREWELRDIELKKYYKNFGRSKNESKSM